MRRIRYRLAWSAVVGTLIVWPAVSYCALLGEDAQRPAAAASDTAASSPQDREPAEQLREGSVLKNLTGTFKLAGNRVTFCPSDQEAAFPVLENLALERVWGMLESAGGRLWSVCGTVTEYRGRNYLLMDRAVVRSAGAKSAAQP